MLIGEVAGSVADHMMRLRVNSDSGSNYYTSAINSGTSSVTHTGPGSAINPDYTAYFSNTSYYKRIKISITKSQHYYFEYIFHYVNGAPTAIQGVAAYNSIAALSTLNILSDTGTDTVYIKNCALWGIKR